MHEMSLADGVLQIVEDAARSQGFSQVTAVRLEIGRLSSVEPEALRFCFDVVVRGSLAEGARLEIVDIPGTGWCLQCRETVPVKALYDSCPRCGSSQVQPTGGTELRVRDLEVA